MNFRVLPAAVLLLALAPALASCGRSAESWTREGDRLLRGNELEEAERAYSRALKENPHHAPAVYGKGWVLYISGFEELKETSRQLFQRAIDYAPEFYGGYRGKGVLLLEDGNVLAAENFLRQAWQRAPEEPAVIESMGQLYLRAGHLDQAEQMFVEAARLAPARGELRRFLADVALARGNFDLALAELDAGRSSTVSGRRGLLLLEEGEVFVQVAWARKISAAAGGQDGDGLEEARRAIDQAHAVLERMENAGLGEEASTLRDEVVRPAQDLLQARAGAGGSEGPNGGGDPLAPP